MRVRFAVFMAILWVVMLVVTLVPPVNDDAPPPVTVPPNIQRLWDLQEALINAGTTTTQGDTP